jgi:isovaleryl-CoA dehydrogenase
MDEVIVESGDGIVDAVRTVARAYIAGDAAEVDRERRFPKESLERLAEVGALGLLAGSKQDGADGDLRSLAAACEAVGEACASTGMVYLMHLVTTAAVRQGGGPAAGALLPALARGELIGTLAFSERGTGAHFYAPELRAVRSNGTVRINGRKSFVTSAGHADVMLVLLQGEGENVDCYAVQRTDSGVAAEGVWTGLGMLGNSSVAVRFDDVTIGADDRRIGPEGTGSALVFETVAPTFLVGVAAVNVGIAQAALTTATEHVRSRRYPDGQTLAELPTIQSLLADMDMRTRAARALLTEAAGLADAGDPGALVPLMEAKISCTEASADVARRALEVCGGQGYTTALSIERHVRDSLAGAVMAPTNGVLRTWVGKVLTGLPVP